MGTLFPVLAGCFGLILELGSWEKVRTHTNQNKVEARSSRAHHHSTLCTHVFNHIFLERVLDIMMSFFY